MLIQGVSLNMFMALFGAPNFKLGSNERDALQCQFGFHVLGPSDNKPIPGYVGRCCGHNMHRLHDFLHWDAPKMVTFKLA